MTLTLLSAEALTNNEPQRVNNYEIVINGVDGYDALEIAVESFPVPKSTIGVIELSHANEKAKFAGRPTFDDLTVVYKDLVTLDTRGILMAWYYSVYDPNTGKMGYAADYKKSGFVKAYGPDGGELGNHSEFDLLGIWPSAFDPGDADHTGEDYVRISLTLSIDKAKMADVVPLVEPGTSAPS